ncbi:MAG TPA: S9 family peptidase [Thermoanaerobaculia bacterium]|nr:S9 family peptidase [Thermoanaerobaculia bacterium]
MRHAFLLVTLCAMTTATPSALAETALPAPVPPVAKQVEKVHLLHGDPRPDPYFWLRDKPNPEVAAYLEAENAYASQVMGPTEPLQKSLYDEMLAHVKETDLSVPYRDGAFLYYYRTEKGKQYRIHCRKPFPDGAEQVLLDLNALATGKKFMSLGAFRPSDDGSLLAYSTDETGFRQYTLAVKDLKTGALLPERMERVTSVAWAADGKTLFYTVEDETTKRSHLVFRHRVGTPASADAPLYEEKDERFGVHVGRTRSGAWLVLECSSHTTSEARVLRADAPEGAWTLVAPREQDHEYDVDHRGDLFYIRTNSGGRNFRLVTAPVASPGRENWKEIVPHRPDVMLSGIDLFKDYLVLDERANGLPRFTVRSFATGESHAVSFPEPVYTVSPETNRVFDTKVFRYGYQSFVTPQSVFDYDMDARKATLLKEFEVPLYDRTQYSSARLWATAPDGTKIPLSVVWRSKTADGKARTLKDGPFPTLLYGYGSYGIPIGVSFRADRLPLLDRGFLYVIAHIRGGGEMGKAWHDAGRMKNKRNTFTDFVSSAEYLVAERITAKDRLAIEGGSAGGLLMGAVVNMRPDLFAAVIAHVPFVDVLNTMSDPTLPLTVGEYEEWGNPAKKDEYDYIRTYCPYTNLKRGAYPAMLVKTSFNDSQVFYHEPAKYVARLRTLKTDQNPLLLKTNMAAGHGGASGRYDYLHEIALDEAFLLTRLGVAR